MVIFKLIGNEKEYSCKEFKELEQNLKNKNILIKKDKENTSKLNITYHTNDNEITKNALLDISIYIYKLFIDKYLKEKFHEYISDTYSFLTENETIEFEKLIITNLINEQIFKSESNSEHFNDLESIIDYITNAINTYKELNINGFITFRTKQLSEMLEKIIDKIGEQYIIDKEYEDFIKLLKYYVDMQECVIPKIILNIDDDDRWHISDKEGNDLYDAFLDFIGEDEKDNIVMEDLLLSGLISNAPDEIEIHHKKSIENHEFIKVIKELFVNKITYVND